MPKAITVIAPTTAAASRPQIRALTGRFDPSRAKGSRTTDELFTATAPTSAAIPDSRPPISR